ncbi:unnamed protein product [Parascedosporium putredinis]|uniref:Alb1-domain-containing protein n=1 Tax=Parascedosporium putredinis TaxID=1442378 RepID=A0A9P1H2I3_9PEZI|nr:unnamed protein product [Parascedosporium putredinis]CAI7994977.1 unnamed protein product [Parascedosporium putredinis]
MGKPSVAKKRKGPSIHSRAARRETSPSIDTDKSLKALQPPTGERAETRPPCSRPAKEPARNEKGFDKAEAISERIAARIEKSVKQGKTIRTRGKTWDEVNETPGATKSKSKKKKGSQAGHADEGWETDEDMETEEPPVRSAGAFQVLGTEGEDEDGDEEIL